MPDPAALDGLLGRRRAAILRALRDPATTHDLASRLAYVRTAAGDALLRAPRGA